MYSNFIYAMYKIYCFAVSIEGSNICGEKNAILLSPDTSG